MARVEQLADARAIEAALADGAPVRVVLVRAGLDDPRAAALCDRAKQLGVRVRVVSAKVIGRLSRRQPPGELLALVGRSPEGDVEAILAGSGAAWLLVGTRYPGNAGFAIRTAEVSGADGIIVDAAFDREQRRAALRLSMRADWFMPVCWHPAPAAIARARTLGRRVIAIECAGERAPWQVDLGGRVLFVVGAEAGGIPAELLALADVVVRVPMAGFIPTYNLQAAVAAVASERLRQLEG